MGRMAAFMGAMAGCNFKYVLLFSRMLLGIGIAEGQQEQAICTDRGFDHVGDVILVDLRIKVLLLLFGVFLM